MFVRAGNIHQHGLHAGACGAEVIHRIDIAEVEALVGRGAERLHGDAKNFGMRFFVADEAGVGDGEEAIGDAAAAEHVSNATVGIGDDGDAIALGDTLQLVVRAGKNLVPIGGIADGGDAVVAEFVVVEADLGEELGVEHAPEAVIVIAVGDHERVEPIFDAGFEIAKMLGVAGEAAVREPGVDSRAIGEEQRVADIEENGVDCGVLGGHSIYGIVMRGGRRKRSSSCTWCEPLTGARKKGKIEVLHEARSTNGRGARKVLVNFVCDGSRP